MSSVEWFKRRLRDKHGVKEDENGERPQEARPAPALERGPGYDVLVEAHRTLSGHGSPVSSAVFSPDGKYVVSGSWDKTVRSWNPLTGNPIQTFPGKNGLVYLPHKDHVNCVRVFPNSKYVASGSDDKTVKVWDIRTGDCLHTLGTQDVLGSLEYKAPVRALSVSANGKYLASGCEDGTVLLWDVSKAENTVEHFQTFEMGSPITSLSFSPSGEYLAVGQFNSITSALWFHPDEQKYEERYALHDARMPPNPAISLSFSPKGSVLGEGSYEMRGQSSYIQVITLWDSSDIPSPNPRVMMRLQEPALGALASIAFSTRDDLLISGAGDGVLRFWDLKHYTCVKEVQAHTKAITSVACSSGGKYVATASEDKTIRLWTVKYE